MIHRRVRRERRESPNTIKEIILNNLCDLCVLCGEIFLENGIGFYEVSYKRRRWPEKFTRRRRAASLIEKETLALASFLLGIN